MSSTQRRSSTAAPLLALVLMGCGATKPATAPPPLTEPKATPKATRVAAPCEAPEGAWGTFQESPLRLGKTSAPAIETPRLRWRAEIGIAGWLNSPVIATDRIFAGSSGNVWNKPDELDGVHALELKTGKTAWFRAFDADVNGVTYANCRVFATADDGTIRSLNAADGAVVWERKLPGRKVYTTPTVLEGLVLVGDSEGDFHALDERDGKTVWMVSFAGPVRGGAASDGVTAFVTSQDRSVVAFDLRTGEFRWRAEIAGAKAIYAAPTLVGELLIVGYVRETADTQPALVALDRASGRVQWHGSDPAGVAQWWGNIRSSPAVVDGLVLWGEPYSNRLVAARVETGEVAFAVELGACMFPHWPSPAVAQGLVYLPRHDGGLHTVDLEQRGPSWSLYLGDSGRGDFLFPAEISDSGACVWDPSVGRPIFASPAVAADGTVVVATGAGLIYAFAGAAE